MFDSIINRGMGRLKRYFSENGIFLLVPLLCWFFYSGELTIGYSRLDLGEHISYFKNLADAFLHGRLYVSDYGTGGDLVFFHNKVYLYWPPVPALVYLPLVAVFGTHLPDALICTLFGALNVYMVMRVVQVMASDFYIPFGKPELVLLGLFWGLGTVHFYMSMDGTVWFISQIMGQTFLLAAILAFLKTEKVKDYIVSGIYFGLAVYTRNDLVFAFVFFIFLYVAKANRKDHHAFLKKGTAFAFPFIIFSILNLWYNYARFGNMFDNGINYHHMNPYFYQDFRQWGYLSTHYLPRNFYVEVIHFPELIFKWPFIVDDPQGFGFFWASPFFFLIIPGMFFYIFKSKIFSVADLLTITGSLLTTVMIAFLIFMVMGTGWCQFAARYTLDFYIFLLIAILFFYKTCYGNTPFRITSVALILLSIVINYCGVYLHFYLY
ncbi:MAG: hypothetical protein JWO06_3283 [Bacteroidota bacterium]|nr:hypothetical protein [Bacteroidota bacterium]